MTVPPEIGPLIPTLSSLPMAVLVTDRQGLILWANSPVSLLTLYRGEELGGRSIQVLDCEQSPQPVLGMLESLSSDVGSFQGASLGRRHDGTAFSFEVTITLIPDAVLNPTHALWILRETPDWMAPDNLAGHPSEHSLLDSEIVRNIGDGVILVRQRDGLIVKANQQSALMCGYSLEELVGMPISALNAPSGQSPAEISESIVAALRKNGSWKGDLESVRKDKSHFWCSVVVTTFLHSHHGPVWIAVHRDITDRKIAELTIQAANEEIAKAEYRYRCIFNSGENAVFVHQFGADGRPCSFLEVNDNACRLLGYERDELLKLRIFQIVVPEEHPNLVVMAKELFVTGHVLWRATYTTKDNRRIPVEINTHLFHLQSCPTMICSVRSLVNEDRIQSALRKTEEMLHKAFHCSPASTILFRLDPDGNRLIEVNEAFERVSGFSRQDTIGRTTIELGLWAEVQEYTKVMQRFRQDHKLRNVECRFKRKNGDVGTALLSAEFIELDGEPCAIATSIDITTMVRAEEQLRGVANHIPGIVFQFIARDNHPMEVTYLSDRCMDFLGVNPLPLDTAFDRLVASIHADDRQRCLRAIQEAARSATSWETEARFIKPNREEIFARVTGEPQKRESELVFNCILLDITDRKTAEHHLQSIFDGAIEGIYRTTAEGKILDANPALLQLSGYDRKEDLPLVHQFYANASDREFVVSQIERDGFIRGYEGQFTRRDGTSGWLSVNARKAIGPDGKTAYYEGFVSDITERKQAEQDRAKLEAQLRQAHKMESVGRLAGGIAHDFNNLLTVINGYSQFLIGRLDGYSPLYPYAEAIHKAGSRAASLTSQLLAFSRKQIIEPKVLSLNQAVSESLPLLERLMGEDIRLEINLGAAFGNVLADSSQIQQVIVNLAVNARDAMPNGGLLSISTEDVDLDEAGIPAGTDAAAGSYVCVRVSDNGEGMDEVVRQQVFEPFFTTKEQGKGTGLGLSMVYGIVRQSGGWIILHSEVGAGTSVEIYLPRTNLRAAQDGAAQQVAEGCGTETILLVEDLQPVRSFTRAALESFGYKVLEAPDGREATSISRIYTGTIDLLLTDVVMPGINGAELSLRLKQQRPAMKALLISGYTLDAISNRAILDQGLPYLAKPFTAGQLAAKVRQVLATPPSAGEGHHS